MYLHLWQPQCAIYNDVVGVIGVIVLRVALANVIFIIVYIHYVIWPLIDWLAHWERYK